MERIIVIGSSGHAAVVLEAIDLIGRFSIQGLVTASGKSGQKAFGFPILGNDNDLATLVRESNAEFAVIAIGDNFVRSRVASKISRLLPDLKFATIIHPRAIVSRSVVLGRGTVVCAGATLSAGVSVGQHCIVNTNASVDHFSRLGNFVSIAPNAAIGGDVSIGDYSAVGLGANVIHGRTIAEHAVIGAGSTVLHDIGACRIAYGSPAREIRDRQPGETYLK